MSAAIEHEVIGGLFVKPSAIAEVRQVLTPDDFDERSYRALYAAMLAMDDQGLIVDPESVLDWLEHAGQLDAVGGATNLGGITMSVVSAANLTIWVNQLRDHAQKRRLTMIGLELVQLSRSGKSADAVLRAHWAALDAWRSRDGSGKGPRCIDDLIGDVIRARDESMLDGCPVPLLVPTALGGLDAKINGLRGGRLYVIAGRPGMLKSVLGLQFADRIALGSGRDVLVHSLEMPGTELTERLLAMDSGVPYAWLQARGRSDRWDAFQDDDYWTLTVDAQSRFKGRTGKIWIDETAGVPLSSIQANAYRMARIAPLGGIVVDYLQLMAFDERRNRNEGLGSITVGLKNLAKELDCPVVLLSQLNRDVEKRTDRRPIMSDLRDSGSIEQDADVVMVLYRDELYTPNPPPGRENAGWVEILIRKQRNGPLGTAFGLFQPERMRIVPAAIDPPYLAAQRADDQTNSAQPKSARKPNLGYANVS